MHLSSTSWVPMSSGWHITGHWTTHTDHLLVPHPPTPSTSTNIPYSVCRRNGPKRMRWTIRLNPSHVRLGRRKFYGSEKCTKIDTRSERKRCHQYRFSTTRCVILYRESTEDVVPTKLDRSVPSATSPHSVFRQVGSFTSGCGTFKSSYFYTQNV